MNIDLSTLPYSCKGSYLVVSQVFDNWCGAKNEAGLYLRTVHSTAMTPLIARLLVTRRGEPVSYTTRLDQATLQIQCGAGLIELCFFDPETLLVRGSAELELTLDFLSDTGAFDYIYLFSRGGRDYHMANCYKNSCRYLISTQEGEAILEQQWQERSALFTRLRFSGKDGFQFSLREIETEWDGAQNSYDFDVCATGMNESLKAFERRMPDFPDKYAKTAQKAAYLLWASIVHPEGYFKRDAMLMSKNWMKNVWSWDHCFNAIALSYKAPDLAWDQFMVMFDCQDPTGLLPDSINDARAVWNFCKPPIHGWALRLMMKNMKLSDRQAQEAYDGLSKWTNWWIDCRDYDGDGLCEYNHGNDSGWDNSTAFSVLPPVLTPELQAFLIVQMDVLSELALRLGLREAARVWTQRSDRMLSLMLENLFVDGLPVAKRSGSHEIVPNDSLLPYVSIVLGEKLPPEIRRRMIRVLSGDTFLTSHGFATESPRSPFYLNDGYWRGPIWAPSTLLLVDGLARCGEIKLVRHIAERFCDMVGASGFAENFDALSGDGLRDRAYTWTASVYLVLLREYL